MPADLVAHPVERLHRDRQFGRRLRRRHVVVDEAPQLVFDLWLRRAVGVAQRPVDQLVRGRNLIGRKRLGRNDIGEHGRRMLTRELAVDERADHVVVRHARQIACGVKTRHGGPGMLVDPHAGGGMATAEPDLGDVHLDVMGAVVVAAVGVERAAGRPLRGVQDVLQRGERLVGQMADLEVDGAARRLDLALHLGHHLARPVVGVDESFARGVDLVAAERIGHVCARGSVVILDQRVDLEAFDTRQLRTGVIRHRVAVARVGRVLVGAVEISRGGQAEPPTRTGRQNHRLRPDDHELAGAAVQRGAPPRPRCRRSSVSTRTGISRFSMRILSRMAFCRITR